MILAIGILAASCASKKIDKRCDTAPRQRKTYCVEQIEYYEDLVKNREAHVNRVSNTKKTL